MHLLYADQLNTYDVLVSDDVVFTRGALDEFLAGPATGRSAKASATESEDDAVSAIHKDHRDVLLAPVVSEKSYGLLDENKYTFLVHPDANKTEIKIAVEKVFGVKVDRRQHAQPRGQAQAHPHRLRPPQGHQARDRHRRRGRPHRHLRRAGLLTGRRDYED